MKCVELKQGEGVKYEGPLLKETEGEKTKNISIRSKCGPKEGNRVHSPAIDVDDEFEGKLGRS